MIANIGEELNFRRYKLMNVTESRFKNRQLHIEDYLQMVSAEQKEYAEVFDYAKIAEKSSIITDYWTNNLLDLILRKENLNKASITHQVSIKVLQKFCSIRTSSGF